jgi:hypothetical protein
MMWRFVLGPRPNLELGRPFLQLLGKDQHLPLPLGLDRRGRHPTKIARFYLPDPGFLHGRSRWRMVRCTKGTHHSATGVFTQPTHTAPSFRHSHPPPAMMASAPKALRHGRYPAATFFARLPVRAFRVGRRRGKACLTIGQPPAPDERAPALRPNDRACPAAGAIARRLRLSPQPKHRHRRRHRQRRLQQRHRRRRDRHRRRRQCRPPLCRAPHPRQHPGQHRDRRRAAVGRRRGDVRSTHVRPVEFDQHGEVAVSRSFDGSNFHR